MLPLTRARELFETHGSKLINCVIMTPPMGTWLGGPAKIIDILPDPKAPEIIFQVQAIEAPISDLHPNEVGVFDDEYIALIDSRLNRSYLQ